MLRPSKDNKHIQFYWNVNERDYIEHFEKAYSDAYNAKYAGMLKALQESIGFHNLGYNGQSVYQINKYYNTRENVYAKIWI